jgi:acetoin utilization deacetylase AcuC-like enzyme
MRNKVKVHFNKKQVCVKGINERSFSKSPLKPILYMGDLLDHARTEIQTNIEINGNFKPFRQRDFTNAHTKRYVENFFNGKKGCESNSLPWSKELAESVRWTNASLYTAIEQSYLDNESIHISPTSGFHHAGPESGSGFCTFSGQVIAAIKMYRKYGVRGAFIDLDGHYVYGIRESSSNKSMDGT